MKANMAGGKPHDNLKDSIPERLKPIFFEGKSKPDLFKDFDCIGFEANNCLV